MGGQQGALTENARSGPVGAIERRPKMLARRPDLLTPARKAEYGCPRRNHADTEGFGVGFGVQVEQVLKAHPHLEYGVLAAVGGLWIGRDFRRARQEVLPGASANIGREDSRAANLTAGVGAAKCMKRVTHVHDAGGCRFFSASR